MIEDGANFLLCHSVNPIVKTSNIKTIDSTKVVVKNVMTSNSELSKADWKTFTYEFKVSDISATAVYFGIKVNGGCTIQIDDIAIDVVNELEYGFKTVTHDMEDYDVGEVTTIEQCGCKDIQVVDDDGNKVLQFTKINGHARLGFNDQTIEKGKKYYFSFDAKEKDADSKSTAPIVVFGNKGGGNGDRRIAIVNDAFSSTNSFTTAGCKYYIDGVEVTHDNFKYSTEWRTYGISFDTSNTDFLKVVSDKYSDFWSKTTYLLFGAQNGVVMYDNISLTGVKDIEITSMPSEKPAVTAYSIRGEQKVEQYVSAGLRFKGSVAADKVEGAEIGFVVAPTPSIYNVEDWYDLNKTVADRETVKYNKGEYYSYNADKEVYEYQLILSGLSTAAGATAYEVPFAAVLYVKSGDTYTYYSLGQTSYGEIGAAYAVQNQTAAAQ